MAALQLGVIRAATVLAVMGPGLGPASPGLSLDLTGLLAPGLAVMIAVCAPLALTAAFLQRPRRPGTAPGAGQPS